MLYFLACTFNTIAMMCSCLILVVVVFLPAATFIGRYHIMAILILLGVLLGKFSIGFKWTMKYWNPSLKLKLRKSPYAYE